jgi:hypothetical protein
MRNNFFFKSPTNNPKKILIIKQREEVKNQEIVKKEEIEIFENEKYNDFDWEQYIRFYKDLEKSEIKTKEEAIKHWEKNGKKEGRKYFKINWDETEDYENFDWVKYIKYYKDLSFMKSKNEAYNHWIINGKDESRIFFKINEEYERLWPF